MSANIRLPEPPKLDGGRPILRALFLRDVALETRADPHVGEDGAHLSTPTKYTLVVIRGADTDQRQVHIRCEIKPRLDGVVPYTGHLTMVSDIVFHNADKITAEIKDQAAAWAAVHPNVGAIRAYIAMLTSIGPYPQLLLGSVDSQQLCATGHLVVGDGEPGPLYPELRKLLDEKAAKD